ncbi:hypothetical protein HNY73_003619 [Argiope bruennichi]|uniref:Uncharacterized protein n=1 Tax=Argiope bruennichi TaxID=94029 RepID=A0A8T0FLQ7_ARGBR|nr:hypothetical protein HNY73_003619 [Argiope bruennichi]
MFSPGQVLGSFSWHKYKDRSLPAKGNIFMFPHMECKDEGKSGGHREKRVRRGSSTEGEFDDELRLCIVVGESRAISDRSLDVHSRKNPREIYGPYVGGYESHIFHVSPRARRRDCPRESLTGKAIVASFGAFGHPITTARHSVPFIFIFSYYDPAYGLPRAGPSRNFISAVAAAGLQGRPTIHHPQIMGLESPGQSLKVYCFFAPTPSVFFFYFSPFGSLFLLGSPGAVTPFSTVLRHLADRYWLLDNNRTLNPSENLDAVDKDGDGRGQYWVALRREEMTATLLSYVTGQVANAGGWKKREEEERERKKKKFLSSHPVSSSDFIPGCLKFRCGVEGNVINENVWTSMRPDAARLLSNNDTPYAVYARMAINS